MLKGKFLILIFLITFNLFSVVNAQSIGSLDEGLEGVGDAKDKIETYTEKSYWGEKWDYLGREWKTILLKNKIVLTIDKICTKISFLFLILFAMPYEMSMILFGVMVLWLFAWAIIFDGIKYSGIVNKGSALILSVLAVIALAHIGLFEGIVVFLIRFISLPESAWARAILFFGIIFMMIFFKKFSEFFGKYLKAKREKDAKKLEDLNRTILGKLVKNLIEFSK